MTIDPNLTLGDLVVAVSTVGAIVGAYHALKTLAEKLHADVQAIIKQIAEHEELLSDHSEGLAALESHIFGRRRMDNLRRTRRQQLQDHQQLQDQEG